MRIKIDVAGRPAPQGSKHGGAAGQLREASAYLPAWRAAVVKATYQAYLRAGVHPEQLPLLRGAVAIEQLTFRVDPGQRADGPPDLDKLTRATLDALTEARLYEDDARVVKIKILEKIHPGPNEVPGATIVICSAEDAEQGQESSMQYRLTVETFDAAAGTERTIVLVQGTVTVIAAVLPSVAAAIDAEQVRPASDGRGSTAYPASVTPAPGAENVAAAPAPAAGQPAAAPRKRGRPSKAEIAAREAAERAQQHLAPPVQGTVTQAPEAYVPPAPVAPPAQQQPYDPFKSVPAPYPVG